MSDINITVNDEIVNIDVIDTPVLVEVTNSPGPAGAGVAVGGTTGQVLAKASNTNYDTVWVNPSTGGVPYSGATGNVNLGEYELKAGQVTLDTSPTGTAAVGTIRWNDTTGTSETTLKGGNVIIKNGVDLVARVVNKVSPNTTLTKAAYQAVRVSGAQGQRLAIELAQANNDAGSADTIGLVTETIAPNQEGFIMTVGQLEGINTTGSLQGETWVDGDVLYLSPTTAGAITNVKPTGATGHLVIIGYVEYAHANNGKIYVKVMNGWELDELHNVSIVTPTNNQGLFYNSSNSLWENKTISTALGYTPVPTTRNITINGVTYDLSADRTWTISTGISGSGTSGQVTYWTGASAVSGSNNLFWDNANGRLGIGTNAPATLLDVYSSVNANSSLQVGSSQNTRISINTQSGNRFGLLTISRIGDGATPCVSLGVGTGPTSTSGVISTNNDNLIFGYNVGNTFTETFRINTLNRLLLGFTTDQAVKLAVNGDTLLRGSGNTSATTALTVQNSDAANAFRVLNNGQINLGNSASFPYIRTVVSDFTQTPTGTKVIFGTQDTTTGNGSFLFASNTLSHTSGTVTYVQLFRDFTPTSGTGSTTHLLLNGAINQTGGANGITRGLYVNPTLTAAADWRSIEWSNNTGWGLYGAGTANNYLAGFTGIGTTTMTYAFNVTNTAATYVAGFRGGSSSYIVVGDTSLAGESGVNVRNSSGQGFIGLGGTVLGITATSGANTIAFATAGTEGMRLTLNRNLLLQNGGTFTDGGQRLQVIGDTLLRGSGATSATTALTVQNSSSTNLLTVRNDGLSTFGGKIVANGSTTSQSGLDVGTLRFQFFATNNAFIAENSFYNGSAFQRVNTGLSSVFYFAGGGFQVGTMPTGTAGTTQTNLNQRMYLTNEGTLAISDTISGGGNITLVASAVLQTDSTTKGFLPPRMTTTQKNAITSPAAGLVVYDTTLNKLCVYTTAWETITSI